MGSIIGRDFFDPEEFELDSLLRRFGDSTIIIIIPNRRRRRCSCRW